MSDARILVVDDEPQIQRFLRPGAGGRGLRRAARRRPAREALRIAANSAPDVVMLDLGLPDMDGKEVLAQARQFSKAPIIVLSARDREAEKIAALDLGADDYVEKPFAIGELLARLRVALRHAQGRRRSPRARGDGLVIDLDQAAGHPRRRRRSS